MDEVGQRVIRLRDDLSGLCRRGFPLVDNLYWDHPSAKVGGSLIRQLVPAAPRPGARLDLRFPAARTASLGRVIELLKSEHQPRFWYRGQRARRQCVYRGQVPAIDRLRPGLTPIEVTLEALAPSAFRSLTVQRPAAWHEFNLPPATDYLAGPMRAIMASEEKALHDLLLQCLDFLVFEVARVALSERVNLSYGEHLLAPGTTISRHLLDLISLSQHYEYGSVMIDVTKDIDTAVWFATRDWESGAVAGSRDGGPGAIYRFDSEAIERMMRQSISGPGAMPPPMVRILGIFGLADISGMFPFLRRPGSQHGGGLLGMENVVTHFLLQMQEAAAVFPFDHATVSGDEIGLTQDDIKPADDRGREIFRPDDKCSASPIAPEELDAFLRRVGEMDERRERLVEHRRNRVI